MKLPPPRHRWNLSIRQAIRLQQRLARQVKHRALTRNPRLIAAGDAAFSADGGRIVAGWVVWDAESGEVVERAVAVRPVRFPYVPGLLSFREAPALIAAVRKLKIAPDVFMVDGQGLAHPRRCGLACHVGLWIDRPTLGCAKSVLCGVLGGERDSAKSLSRYALWHRRLACVSTGGTPVPQVFGISSKTAGAGGRSDLFGEEAGAACPLVHEGEVVGCAVRTRREGEACPRPHLYGRHFARATWIRAPGRAHDGCQGAHSLVSRFLPCFSARQGGRAAHPPYRAEGSQKTSSRGLLAALAAPLATVVGPPGPRRQRCLAKLNTPPSRPNLNKPERA
jgi:deoxyinosine 3'endonuclease (endonuclease V)